MPKYYIGQRVIYKDKYIVTIVEYTGVRPTRINELYVNCPFNPMYLITLAEIKPLPNGQL